MLQGGTFYDCNALKEIRVKPGACALGEIRILASDADVK